jgi:hypothetical protein
MWPGKFLLIAALRGVELRYRPVDATGWAAGLRDMDFLCTLAGCGS